MTMRNTSKAVRFLKFSKLSNGCRPHRIVLLWVMLAGFMVLVSSCSGLKHSRVTLPEETPEAFSATGTVPIRKWWEAFEDPELNRLVEKVLSNNLRLEQAWARLEQSHALAVQAAASRWPVINAELTVQRNRTSASVDSPVQSTVTSHEDVFSVSAPASYELDVWGRISALNKAARLDVKASQDDIDTIAVSLIAEVCDIWISIIEYNALLNLTKDQLEVNNTYLKLVQLRFGQGLVSSLDVYQQRQQVAAVQSQIPPIEARLQILHHQLAVLLGKPPRTDIAEIRSTFPELPELPDTGVPSELLTLRPDIRAARRRVEATDYRVGAAIANRFPAFRLRATTGFYAADIAKIFENWVWEILANMTSTMIDGGYKTAEIDRNRAVLKERLAQYRKTVLDAVKEVEDALVNERQQTIYLDKLQKQYEAAKLTLDEAYKRYLHGLSDYLTVLTYLKAEQSLRQQLITARKQLFGYRIQLCRSLGAVWTENSDPL